MAEVKTLTSQELGVLPWVYAVSPGDPYIQNKIHYWMETKLFRPENCQHSCRQTSSFIYTSVHTAQAYSISFLKVVYSNTHGDRECIR